RFPLGLDAVQHRALERARLVERRPLASRRQRPQRRSDGAHVGERGRALVTPREVRADGDLIRDRELAIVERLKAPPRRRARERLHTVLASRSCCRSAWRARVSRDLTVPTATPSEKAISS